MNENNPVILDVPYYKQSRYYTCGPAALMMVMKYWDKNLVFSKENEYALWLKSNPFVFLGGTLQYGLAKTALKKGYNTEIYQENRFSDNYLKFKVLFNLYEYIISLGARNSKIPIYFERNLFDIIRDALDRRIPPLVLLNLKPINGENVFHWVVITGLYNNTIYLNDPYVPNYFEVNENKNYPVDIEVFKKAITIDMMDRIRIPPCVVLVYK